MKQWKYYYISSSDKEPCGTLYASDINEAYAIASRMKQLSEVKFREVFEVDLL
mgnify:CR=1 FL=1